MATSHPIDIPIAHHDDPALPSSVESETELVFTPADSLSTSLDSASTIDNVFEQLDLEPRASARASQSLKRDNTLTKYDAAKASDLLDDSTAVAFGRGPDRWLYHPSSGLFDLSRMSHTKLMIPSQTENMSGIVIDPSRTIMVIVDMQNYFVHPACYPHIAGVAAVPPILSTMRQCRKLGIQIAYLNWVIEDKDMDEMPPAVQRGWSVDRLKTHGVGWHVNLGSELPDGQGRCLWKGSWNAELYDPIKAAVLPSDVTFLKNRPSGMWSTECDMARYVKEHDMKTILFAGVNSDQCVLGTLTDSYSKSYDCLLLRDCVGTATTELMAQELVEWNVARNYGFVIDSTEFAASQVLCA
jgi:phosphatidylethanolamine-binding protein